MDIPARQSTARRRVVIADNNADLARALGEIIALEGDLEFAGYTLTGTDAISKVREGGVDVLILDLGLPDCSGLSVLERLRVEAPAVKVVIHTGHVSQEVAARAKALGAVDCVVKGGDFAVLVAAIRNS